MRDLILVKTLRR